MGGFFACFRVESGPEAGDKKPPKFSTLKVDREIPGTKFMEVNNMGIEVENYASKGQANLNTVLGSLGTASFVAPMLGNLLGGWGGGNICNENMPTNRFELNMVRDLTSKDMEIAYLRGRDASKSDDLAVYKYIDGELKDIRSTLCAQAVTNQRTADSFALAAADLAAVKASLEGQIQLEAERRCCGDNSIVTYANATFYPKLVADVTAGTTTTAQVLYNPIPSCGGCCGK